MEKTPKGNQGSAKEVMAAESGMTDKERFTSSERRLDMHNLQELARKSDISVDVFRQILDSAEKTLNGMVFEINGLKITYHRLLGTNNINGLNHIEFNNEILTSNIQDAVEIKYGKFLDALYLFLNQQDRAEDMVKDERAHFLESERRRRREAAKLELEEKVKALL